MIACWRYVVLSVTFLLASVALASSVSAEALRSTVAIALPTQFEYKRTRGDDSVEAGSVTGLRVEYVTSWYLGFGVGQYRSAVLNRSVSFLSQDLYTTYNFLEVSGNVKFGWLLLAAGYGSGTVQYSPETNPSGVTWKESEAYERFFTVGFQVNPRWSVHSTTHWISAEADQRIGNMKHKRAFEAEMQTTGFAYTF